MLGKLFRQPVQRALALKTQRHSKAHEFVCLREAFNRQGVEESSANFKKVAQKYNLGNEELLHLIKWLSVDASALNKYVNYDHITRLQQETAHEWRNSRLYTAEGDFNSWVSQARLTYPDIANYAQNYYGKERRQAVQVLDDIFVTNGPRDSRNEADVSRAVKGFRNRVDSYVFTLRENKTLDQSLVNDVEGCLKGLVNLIENDPVLNYGLLRYYVDRAVNRQTDIATTSTSAVNLPASERKLTELTELETATAADPVDLGDDIPSIIEGEAQAIRGNAHFSYSQWVQNKRIILEAQVAGTSTFAWQVLAGLLGFSFVYCLYQGDASTLTLVGLPALAAIASLRGARTKLNQTVEYLVQMNINRDGKTLDLFVQRPAGPITKIEGVPVRDFRLRTGNFEREIDAAGADSFLGEDRLTSISAHRIRQAGGAKNAHIATFGDRLVLVPFNYRGNNLILSKVFEGKEVKFE